MRKQAHLIKKILPALFIVCLLFTASLKNTVNSFSQLCLAIFTDHYYLIYFMLPIFLLSCFFIIEDGSEIYIIRYKSYFSYFFHKWLSWLNFIVLFIVTQLIAALIVGAKMPFGNNWVTSELSTAYELFF